MNIEYSVTDGSGLDVTEHLWKKLVLHHIEHSRHFTRQFREMTFEKRKRYIFDKTVNGEIRIDLARDTDTGELVGYCISTITEKRLGEIDSIYIESEYRGEWIGDAFMKKALQWMDENGVTRKILSVGEGNEEVISFYSRYNFYPRAYILEQVEKSDE